MKSQFFSPLGALTTAGLCVAVAGFCGQPDPYESIKLVDEVAPLTVGAKGKLVRLDFVPKAFDGYPTRGVGFFVTEDERAVLCDPRLFKPTEPFKLNVNGWSAAGAKSNEARTVFLQFKNGIWVAQAEDGNTYACHSRPLKAVGERTAMRPEF